MFADDLGNFLQEDDPANEDEGLVVEVDPTTTLTAGPSDDSGNSVASISQQDLMDQGRDEIKEVQRIAQPETRTVRIWRLVVGMILLVAGALVSWGTYYYLDHQLHDETVDKVRLTGTVDTTPRPRAAINPLLILSTCCLSF